ncbi:MAG: hypothetical protein RI932_1694, partial [Pseudomonadota bacterium]
ALRKALAAAVETDALLAHAGSFSHDRFAENLADHILTLLEKG